MVEEEGETTLEEDGVVGAVTEVIVVVCEEGDGTGDGTRIRTRRLHASHLISSTAHRTHMHVPTFRPW